jgi:hypothetical protein
MRVLDANGDDVGTVEDLKMGDSSAATTEGQSVTSDDGLFQDLVKGLTDGGADLSDEQRERLLRLGYIKVDRKGLFKGDLYVAADDIERVSDDSVYLTFTPE